MSYSCLDIGVGGGCWYLGISALETIAGDLFEYPVEALYVAYK